MSTLSLVARSARSNVLVIGPEACTCVTRRLASSKSKNAPAPTAQSKPSYIKKRKNTNPLKYRGTVRGALLNSFRPMTPKAVPHNLFDKQTSLGAVPVITKNIITTKPVGTLTRFPIGEKNPMHTFGIPRHHIIEFSIITEPCSIIREVTVEACNAMTIASKQSSMENRMVLTGPSGCGKSFLMMQIVAYCLSDNWIVLYSPRSNKFVDSSTQYVYDPRTRTYVQPRAARAALHQLRTANLERLQTLRTRDQHELERHGTINADSPLVDLIDIGLKDQSFAPRVLSDTMDELGYQDKYPVLLAVDDFQALFSKSTYKDPSYSAVKTYHLSMPRLFMDYASGQKSFTNGAFLGALCMSNTIHSVSLELREGLQLPGPVTSPFVKRSQELLAYTEGLKTFPVPEALAYHEAASLFEAWQKTTALHSTANDELFLSKYSESCGNARDFVQGGLLATLRS